MEDTGEKVFFTNSRGYGLAGVLRLPEGLPPFPVVIFSHGFASGKDSPRSLPIARKLVDEGIATFLFDFTGHGESEGTKEESTVLQQLDDLKHAVSLVRSRSEIEAERLGLHGSSSGCLVCLYFALEGDVETMVLRAPRVNGQFPDLYARAGGIKAQTLFIQGSEDPLLPYTQRFYRAMRAPAYFRVIEGADHLFTNPRHYQIILDVTVDWFKERLIGGISKIATA